MIAAQVFELSCAQREAEQHRTADSASTQESLLSVTTKYALALYHILWFHTAFRKTFLTLTQCAITLNHDISFYANDHRVVELRQLVGASTMAKGLSSHSLIKNAVKEEILVMHMIMFAIVQATPMMTMLISLMCNNAILYNAKVNENPPCQQGSGSAPAGPRMENGQRVMLLLNNHLHTSIFLLW